MTIRSFLLLFSILLLVACSSSSPKVASSGPVSTYPPDPQTPAPSVPVTQPAVAGEPAILPSPPAPSSSAVGDAYTLRAGTRLYLVTDREVSSARGESDVGTIVPCRVWRDVEYQRNMFIRAGTPADCRVDKVRRRHMGGVQGKVSIAGMETKSVDGHAIMLSGGYNKEGSSRKGAVWTVGLLLFWPALFVPGGAAELPPGTVFDVTTVNDLRLASNKERPRRVLDLSSLANAFSAEVLLDELLSQSKPETMRIKVTADNSLPAVFMIDNVNGKAIQPLPLTVIRTTQTESGTEAICEIRLKQLAKYFQKGINRFEVACTEGAERQATEVILDIQM